MYPGVYAAANPDKPAVIMAGSGQILTYGELEDRSAKLARGLHDLGLRKGDVIAMLADNSTEALELYWAALRSGLYVTAVNHHLTAEEAAYIINDCDARVLFTSASFADLATDVLELTPTIEWRFAWREEVNGHGSYENLVATAGPPLSEMPRGSDMLYSSGTTGRPKGVKPPLMPVSVDEPGHPLTAFAGKFLGLNADDVYLTSAPMYHAAPLRWSAVVHSHGGTVVLMERFSAEGSLAAIAKHGVTVLQMVPTMFVRLLQLSPEVRAGYNHSTLRMAIHAAAPCPPEVKQAMIDWWGPILVEYYGSTEGNGMTFISSEEWMRKPGSVGRSVLGPVHVCDEAGAEVPSGEVGLVYFEREVRPFEYHKDPEKTAAAQHPQHPTWTAVGDMGYVDDEGYLFLTDRKAFVIISGGVNIYPQEVENCLALHPAIYDVAVIGVPEPEFGEEVKAVVQLREGYAGTPALAQDLITYVRDRIAHYKAPRSVDFVRDLPRTPAGKLVKGEIRKQYL